jgi:hypothetical protein
MSDYGFRQRLPRWGVTMPCLRSAGNAITVAAIVAVLTYHATEAWHFGSAGLRKPVTSRVSEVMLVLTLVLSVLAVVNSIFIT